jgi:hypothetical protein
MSLVRNAIKLPAWKVTASCLVAYPPSFSWSLLLEDCLLDASGGIASAVAAALP